MWWRPVWSLEDNLRELARLLLLWIPLRFSNLYRVPVSILLQIFLVIHFVLLNSKNRKLYCLPLPWLFGLRSYTQPQKAILIPWLTCLWSSASLSEVPPTPIPDTVDMLVTSERLGATVNCLRGKHPTFPRVSGTVLGVFCSALQSAHCRTHPWTFQGSNLITFLSMLAWALVEFFPNESSYKQELLGKAGWADNAGKWMCWNKYVYIIK